MSENGFKILRTLFPTEPLQFLQWIILYYLHLTLILLIENQTLKSVNSDTVLHNLSYEWSNDINTWLTLIIIIKKNRCSTMTLVYDSFQIKKMSENKGGYFIEPYVECIWSRLWRGSVVVWCFDQSMPLNQSKCRTPLLPHKRTKNETRYIRLYILKVSQKFASLVKNSTKMYLHLKMINVT